MDCGDLRAVPRRNLPVVAHRAVVLLALLCVAGTTAAALAAAASNSEPSGATERFTVPHARMSLEYPANWHITTRRLNGVIDPVTRFTVTSFTLRQSKPDADFCARTLGKQWPSNGAYVQVTEELDGASLKKMLRRVPPRPKRFSLASSGAGGLCTRPVSGQLMFHQLGRAFYIYYGVGSKASTPTRHAIVAILESLRISP
ncbi:MAG: hypothetical protein ACJ76I_03345 [Gaiellaceae bacterium]